MYAQKPNAFFCLTVWVLRCSPKVKDLFCRFREKKSRCIVATKVYFFSSLPNTPCCSSGSQKWLLMFSHSSLVPISFYIMFNMWWLLSDDISIGHISITTCRFFNARKNLCVFILKFSLIYELVINNLTQFCIK